MAVDYDVDHKLDLRHLSHVDSEVVDSHRELIGLHAAWDLTRQKSFVDGD